MLPLRKHNTQFYVHHISTYSLYSIYFSSYITL
nr:MAG TPA: hypothetical protein [Caudoviricetes sp.]